MHASLLLIVLAGPVPLAWALAARVERKGAPVSRIALVVLFSWCLLQTALGLSLGAVGALRWWWLLGAEGLLFLLGLWLRRGAPRPPVLAAPARPLPALVLSLLGAVGAWLVWRAMVEPIVETDSLAYHLPTIAQWYQTGRLAMMDQYPLFSHYPYGWEILGALFVLPLGSDFLVALPNVLAWALFGLAIYCLSTELGATREASLGAAALALTIVEVTANVTTLHIDLPFAAVFLSGLLFGVRFLRTRARSSLGLFLAAAGLALGIKTSAVVYLIALAPVGLVARRRVAPAQGEHGGNGLLVLGAAALLFLGGFWYLRNLVQTGNPLGPVHVGLGGITLFPGRYDLAHFRRTTLLAVFAPGQWTDWSVLLRAVQTHLGTRFWALLLLAAPAVPALFLRRTAPARGRLLFLLALVGVTALLYVTTPYSGDNGTHGWRVTPWVGQALRYALPCLGLLAALAAVTATAVGLPGAALLTLGGVSAAAVLWRGGATGMLLLAAALAAWALHCALRPAPARRAAAGGAVAALALGIGLLPLAHAARASARAAAYGPTAVLVAQGTHRRDAVGYLLCNRSYPLYGPDLQQSVVYLPVTAHDARAWQQLLRRNRVALVAIGPVQPTPEERELVRWLTSAEGPLVPITHGDPFAQMQLYRPRR